MGVPELREGQRAVARAVRLHASLRAGLGGAHTLPVGRTRHHAVVARPVLHHHRDQHNELYWRDDMTWQPFAIAAFVLIVGVLVTMGFLDQSFGDTIVGMLIGGGAVGGAVAYKNKGGASA